MTTRLTVNEIVNSERQVVTHLPYRLDEMDDNPTLDVLIKKHQPKRVADVGVWMGAFVIKICTASCVEEVTCVDSWEYHMLDSTTTVYEQFLANCCSAGISGKIYPIQMTSLEGAKYCTALGLTFDMIWIDADHSTKSVKEDIAAWMPLLASNGLMCGAAWGWQTEPFSVRNAVIKSAALFDMKVTGIGNFWWYTKEKSVL